jgi:hypothetical protein
MEFLLLKGYHVIPVSCHAHESTLSGSRQYAVLAYLARANTQREAQRCAAEAVIYEAPWDEEHQATMREFYRQHFLR